MEEESRELNFLLIRYLERITSISGKGGHPPEWFKNLVGYFEQQNLLPQLEIPNFDGPPSTISKFEDIVFILSLIYLYFNFFLFLSFSFKYKSLINFMARHKTNKITFSLLFF